MNRAERRKKGVEKQDVDRIQMEERVRTVNTYSVAVASVLWDLGRDREDLIAIMDKVLERFDSFDRNYATAEDFRQVLREEANYEIEYAGHMGDAMYGKK